MAESADEMLAGLEEQLQALRAQPALSLRKRARERDALLGRIVEALKAQTGDHNSLLSRHQSTAQDLTELKGRCGDAPITEIAGIENLSQVVYNLLCPNHFDLIGRIQALEHKVKILEAENYALKKRVSLEK